MLGLQYEPYLQATDSIVKPDAEQRDEASIYLDLCRYSGVNFFGSAFAQKVLERISKKTIDQESIQHHLPQRGILSFLMWICGAPGMKHLLRHPHGVARPRHLTNFLAERLLTNDRKVHLAPTLFMDRVKDFESFFELEKANLNRFKLIGKRAVKTHNGWTHNYEPFLHALEFTNHLYMNPLDAEELELKEDDLVDVTSESGKVRIRVRFLEEIARKSVALPHGWGHQKTLLSVAKKAHGVNVNILSPSGPEKIDPLSGNALLTGIVVDVTKAEGAQSTTSWSGLDE